MLQLFGEDTVCTDNTLLREMFLQRLPSNVCMVKASSGDRNTVEELAVIPLLMLVTNPQQLDEFYTLPFAKTAFQPPCAAHPGMSFQCNSVQVKTVERHSLL